MNRMTFRSGLAIATVATLACGCTRAPSSEGFAVASGRLEAKELDVATKHAGRVAEVMVDEGAGVEAEQAVARMDPESFEAQLARAEALVVEARERRHAASALIVQRQSELLLSEKELDRMRRLFRDRINSQREVDIEETRVDTGRAALDAARANFDDASAAVSAAEAEARRVRVELEDHVLRAPRAGRVLYRLAEPGEVLPAGGRVLTLIDLSDVYMTVFLPAAESGRTMVGADARIALDALPDSPLHGRVAFVSPAAQFTPKQVETRSQREQLAFRVKVKVVDSAEGVAVNPGARGDVWIRLVAEAPWPTALR